MLGANSILFSANPFFSLLSTIIQNTIIVASCVQHFLFWTENNSEFQINFFSQKTKPCEISLCQTGTKCVDVVQDCGRTDCPLMARCVKERPCDTMQCESGQKCVSGVEPGCNTGLCGGTGECVPISD